MYTNVSYQKLDGVSHRRLFTHVSTLNLQRAKTHFIFFYTTALPTPKAATIYATRFQTCYFFRLHVLDLFFKISQYMIFEEKANKRIKQYSSPLQPPPPALS